MHKYSYSKGRKFLRNKKKFVGLISIGFGVVLLLYFFFPLLSYHVYLSSAFAGVNIESPLPQRYILNSSPTIGGLFSSGINNVTSDYRDARNWFPTLKADASTTQVRVNEYEFSIPSQNINNAKVSAIDYDLSKHLVQYFSTSKSPTDKGTSVIFGHSTLPQWFNPSDYTTIFAKLHTMKNGDEVILTVNGKNYTYKVFAISIMGSDDPNIFSQSYDNSYVTIVTCTPPGTTWKRLVVRTSLVQS